MHSDKSQTRRPVVLTKGLTPPPAAAPIKPLRQFSRLYNAARIGDALTLKACIAAGADVNERSPDPHLPTALLAAIAVNSLACVKLLLSHGADLEARCEVAQWTPLMAAVVMANQKVTPIIRELVLQGADAHATCINGNTPLREAQKHYARRQRSPELMMYLSAITR